jgi:hypothetical protein
VRRNVTSTGGDPGSIGMYPLFLLAVRMPVARTCRKPICGPLRDHWDKLARTDSATPLAAAPDLTKSL